MTAVPKRCHCDIATHLCGFDLVDEQRDGGWLTRDHVTCFLVRQTAYGDTVDLQNLISTSHATVCCGTDWREGERERLFLFCLVTYIISPSY